MSGPPFPREAYEGDVGGWTDGRLGQAYDLIDSIRQEWPTESDIRSDLNKLLSAIETADVEMERFEP